MESVDTLVNRDVKLSGNVEAGTVETERYQPHHMAGRYVLMSKRLQVVHPKLPTSDFQLLMLR